MHIEERLNEGPGLCLRQEEQHDDDDWIKFGNPTLLVDTQYAPVVACGNYVLFMHIIILYLKKNWNVSKPSEHRPKNYCIVTTVQWLNQVDLLIVFIVHATTTP